MSDDLVPVPPSPPSEPETLEAERIPRAVPAPRDRRVETAWAIAIAADLVQIVLFPLFAAGAISPWSDALDFVIAIVLVRLVGWHWSFLPTIVAELIPFADLIPSWTIAMFLATRGRDPRRTLTENRSRS